MARLSEDRLAVAVLDQFSNQEEGNVVGDELGLLKISACSSR